MTRLKTLNTFMPLTDTLLEWLGEMIWLAIGKKGISLLDHGPSSSNGINIFIHKGQFQRHMPLTKLINEKEKRAN